MSYILNYSFLFKYIDTLLGKDDKGKVIGLNNAIKLVKEIPNKIKDTMGIIPEVKIEEENNLMYLVVKIDNKAFQDNSLF